MTMLREPSLEAGTVGAWISWGEEVLSWIPEDGRREARSLMSVLTKDPLVPWVRGGERLSGEEARRYREWVLRRAKREPFFRITGVVPFWGREFRIGPGVLVPRPETETLVEAVLDRTQDNPPRTILDLGTGSGILALTFLAEFPAAKAVAVDRFPAPVVWTRENAKTLGLVERLSLVRGDWTSMLAASGTFDLVVSNPPYVPAGTIPDLEEEVRSFDPREALDGGPDGLSAYRGLIDVLPCLLNPGGWAAFEIGGTQGGFFRDRDVGALGLSGPWIVRDVGGLDRVVLYRKDECEWIDSIS